MARVRNLKIWKGETWSRGFLIVKDGLPLEDGWSVSAVVKSTPDLTVHTWSTAAGNATLLDGYLILTVEAAESADWTWTHGTYSAVISKDDLAERVITGAVFLHE